MSMNTKVKMSETPVEELRLLLITESLDLMMWQYVVFCEVLYCWQISLGRLIPMSAHVTGLDASKSSLSLQQQWSQSSYENGKAQSKTTTNPLTSPLLGSQLSSILPKSKTIFSTRSRVVQKAIKLPSDANWAFQNNSWSLPNEGMPRLVDAPLWYQINNWHHDKNCASKTEIRAREKARQLKISWPAPKPNRTGPSLPPPKERRYYSPTDHTNVAGGIPELSRYRDVSEPKVEEPPAPFRPAIVFAKPYFWPGISSPDGPPPEKMGFWKRLFTPSVQEPSLQALKERHRAVMSTDPDNFVRAQLNKKMPYDLIKEEEKRRERFEKEQVAKRKKREEDRKRKKKERAKGDGLHKEAWGRELDDEFYNESEELGSLKLSFLGIAE